MEVGVCEERGADCGDEFVLGLADVEGTEVDSALRF
jgi:hypothetical protein